MKRVVQALLVASLIASGAAWAQGTNPSGTRNGYGGGYTTATSPTAPSAPAGSTSSPSSATRNGGTGQGRTEGAMGLSPQLQRELGVGRQ
jgi:hypothetical protein